MQDSRHVVADASVILKWVIPETYSDEASRLRDDHLLGKVAIHAPNLVLLEIASALRKYTMRGVISRRQAEEALLLISDSDIHLTNISNNLVYDSFKLSLDLGITVYDAAYIALALNISALFYTSDEKLLANNSVRKLGIVHHIKNYREAHYDHFIH